MRTDQLEFVSDLLLNKFINSDIIFEKDLSSLKLMRQSQGGLIVPEQFHLTLFRIKKHQILNLKNEVDTEELVRKFNTFDNGETTINKINI